MPMTQEDVNDFRVVMRSELERYHGLLEAIREHHRARGHERCWENDRKLYVAAGLIPGEQNLPPVEEHRLACDRYRAAIYDLPVEQEPCAQVERLQKINSGLADRVAGQSQLLSQRAEKETT